jgi:hypothetical protein
MKQSPYYIRQALQHDIRCVGEYFEDSWKQVEVVDRRPEWSYTFVDLARRDLFGQRDKKRRSRGNYNPEPWKNFYRGKTVERRDQYLARRDQREQIQQIEEEVDRVITADFADDVVGLLGSEQAEPEPLGVSLGSADNRFAKHDAECSTASLPMSDFPSPPHVSRSLIG